MAKKIQHGGARQRDGRKPVADPKQTKRLTNEQTNYHHSPAACRALFALSKAGKRPNIVCSGQTIRHQTSSAQSN